MLKSFIIITTKDAYVSKAKIKGVEVFTGIYPPMKDQPDEMLYSGGDLKGPNNFPANPNISGNWSAI